MNSYEQSLLLYEADVSLACCPSIYSHFVFGWFGAYMLDCCAWSCCRDQPSQPLTCVWDVLQTL